MSDLLYIKKKNIFVILLMRFSRKEELSKLDKTNRGK
jgi:hypothetical protein